MVFVLLLVLVAGNSVPGILFGMAPAALNNVLQGLLPQVEYSIKSLPIPKISVPVFEKTGMASQVDLEQVKITALYIDAGNSGLFINAAHELQFTIPDLTLALKFVWSISSSTSSHKKGNGKISINKATFDSLLKAEKTKNSYFTVKKSEFKIEKLEVFFDEPSGLYNWVLEAANRKMKGVLEEKVNKLLSGYVELIAKGVKSLPLNGPVELGLGLSESPAIETDLIKFFIDGTARVSGKDYPIDIPNTSTLKYTSKKDFGLYISEYSLNTILKAEHEHSPIKFSTEDLDLNITTDLLEPVFEDIEKELGNFKESQVICRASQSPSISFAADLVNGNSKILCSVLVEQKKVVDLEIDVVSKLLVRLNRGSIFMNVEDCRVESLSCLSSTLKKPVKTEGIKNLLNVSLKLWKGVVSQFIFPEGIALPGFLTIFVKDLLIEVENSLLKIEGNTYFPMV